MIEAKKLTKYYGKSRGIIDIDLEIKKGEIFGFIGPNGAGKSTTIRLLLSLIRPTNGSAIIDDMDCFNESKKIKQILGYVPSEVNYYDGMRVMDLFDYSSKFYRKNCSARINILSERLGLDTAKKINALSYGNKKKVAIIQALIHEPKVLIFDEPTSGLDPLVQSEFFKILEEEKAKGTTILFSSHVLSEVQKVCDRIAIIKDGQILKIEQIESLRQNQFRQIEIYFKEKAEQSLYQDMPIKNLSEIGNALTFLYTGDIHKLLTKLAEDKGIENISIEEPSLEDIFMHYYTERGNVK